ncbi:3', 5'-cyclic nucleotide phosphodiesterase domain-containing protein, putative [Eimeria mitis]|uniref:3', 5'-cyclic nucleotide phosphodiesterase domain-containing protein, putative n=1 Tax=Eimeria mitis TaxID=44415 RepID=U6K0P9_9EIME|nr:3', 5'-cyclic nucleotide phosphodiesterase domain-containing protein, putative [Eimeria mitis]CDJ29857.1 3', 5'-cyclic nucleotide phosphodiesterase domain-containing protein, putative [Eimeria mitis]
MRPAISACPVHMSSVTAFASALAANICVAVDGSAAFCFVRDVETEQLIGAYATRPPILSVQQTCPTAKGDGNHGECVHALSQPSRALSKQKTVKSIHPKRALSLQSCFNSLTVEAETSHACSGGPPCGEPLLGNASEEAATLLSALFAEDARASNSCSLRPAQPQAEGEEASRASSQSVSNVKSFRQSCCEETATRPSNMSGCQPQEGSSPDDPTTAKPSAGSVQALPPLAVPELIAVSSDSLVGSLMNNLKDGTGTYCYEPTTGRLSPAKASPQTSQCGGSRDSFPSGTAKGLIIACRMEDEGARSACAAMAEARVAYVGPGPDARRLPSHLTGVPTAASHQGAQPDGAALGNRLASVESVNTGDVLKSSMLPHTAGRAHQANPSRTSKGLHGTIPLLFSATIEQPTAAVHDGATFRFPEVPASGRVSGIPGETHFAIPSPRRTVCTDNPPLTAQPGLGVSVTPVRSVAADFPNERPPVDKDGHDDNFDVTSTLHSTDLETTLGIVFCLNPKRADAQPLLKAIAKVCAPPMALLLQQQWLRRDRFKRVLQLELHRTVFQETSIPIRMMQRLLALLHAAVGAEAAAFFIADTQNRNFICLGGHKKATGLSLSGDHQLLGEAARQQGRTVIFNFLPQGFNAEYDSRARFESKHAMLVPLLNTQGHVKAVVVLLNRSHCGCERMKQAAEVAEKECTCEGRVRLLEPLGLAVDAWSAETAPCGQLTNVCMAGMSLLQPMETMVSYVMGDQQRDAQNARRPFGAVMEQIENFVLRDRRKMMLSLRRCASVTVTEPTSSRALSGAIEARNLNISSSGEGVGKTLCTPRRRHVSNIPPTPGTAMSPSGERKASEQNARFGGAEGDITSAGRGSCASLPIVTNAGSDATDDRSSSKYPEQEVRLLHSSSAPLVLYSGLRHSSTGGEELTSGMQLAQGITSDEGLAFRHRRSTSLPSLVFSATLQKCTRPFDAIRKQRVVHCPYLLSTAQLSLEPYRRLDLDIWRRTGDELQLFFFLALEELGVMVKSEKAGLQAFFALIRDAYHTDNPYHNFYHAMHVAQMCWLFLTRYSCRDALTLTEQLGLMLAALTHDVDHPGVNNSSLIEEHHPLAIVYNDKAVLENHHASFATSAMMKLGLFSRKTKATRKPPCPGSSAFSSDASVGSGAQPFLVSSACAAVRQQHEGEDDCADDEDEHTFYPSFAEVRRVLITCILATDMELFRHHHEAMRKRGQMKRTTGDFLNSDEDRALLTTCLIHCADISNPLLPERRNVQWASLIIQEFNAQVEMERHKGLPVTVFMDTRTELSRTQSQIGFLSFVVLDQFRALADLVPGAEELVIQGEKNLEDWQAAMDILREAERREA